MTKNKKIAVSFIIFVLLILDVKCSCTNSFLYLMFSAVFFALFLKRKQLWALIPAGYCGYYGTALILYENTRISMNLLLIPMFFVVPGVVLAVFGLKNNFKGFFDAGIFLFISGIFFIVWKLSFSIAAAVFLAIGILEIIKYLIAKKTRIHFVLGVIFFTAAAVLTIRLQFIIIFAAAVMILMMRKEPK